jgi:hypothetical protein
MSDNIIPIPRNVEAHEYQVQAARENENLMRKLGSTIEQKLKSIGALKVKIEGVVYNDNQSAVKASYQMGLNEQKAEFHMIKDNLGNYNIKGFENSIDKAETILKAEQTFETFETETELTFDLSSILAIQHGDEYRVEYPALGVIANLANDEITENNIRIICAATANDMGLEPKFINEFKVNYKNEDHTYKADYKVVSSDSKINDLKDLNEQVELKHEGRFDSVRRVFIESMKIKAENHVKMNACGWKVGIPHIESSMSYIEINDGQYSGNVLVKAKINGEIKTYALPVENGKLTAEKDVSKFIIEESKFQDIVKNEIEARLTDRLNNEMKLSLETEAEELKMTSDKLVGVRVSDIQTAICVPKINLEDVEDGDIYNVGGIKYKVEVDPKNANYWRLNYVAL